MARSSIKRQSTGSTYSSSNKRPRHISQSPSTDSDNEVKEKSFEKGFTTDEDEDVKGSDSEKSDDNEEQYESNLTGAKELLEAYKIKAGLKKISKESRVVESTRATHHPESSLSTDDDKENKVDKDQSETESEEDDEEWHRHGDSGEVDKNESDGGLRVNGVVDL
ncbi:hypothetical protein BY996DRAFT_6465750 [Phakopsora pachyrhizi]|nr:hypothetical protein BY996DRAFT_6465750 [Phakopsora pachyrhizi]